MKMHLRYYAHAISILLLFLPCSEHANELAFDDLYQMLGEKKCGIGILVSSVPKETKAIYSLRDPSEVRILVHLSYFSPQTFGCVFREAYANTRRMCRNCMQVMEFLKSLVTWKKMEGAWRMWNRSTRVIRLGIQFGMLFMLLIDHGRSGRSKSEWNYLALASRRSVSVGSNVHMLCEGYMCGSASWWDSVNMLDSSAKWLWIATLSYDSSSRTKRDGRGLSSFQVMWSLYILWELLSSA